MKTLKIISALCLLASSSAFAASYDKMAKSTPSNIWLGPEAFGQYYDFHFDSSNTDNTRRFDGHSTVVGVNTSGIVHYRQHPYLIGLSAHRTETDIKSVTELSPGPLYNTELDLNSNTIYGHVGTLVNNFFPIDIGAGYGHNSMHNNYVFLPGDLSEARGNVSFSGDTYLARVGTFGQYTYREFLISGSLSYLYTQVETPRYQVSLTSTNLPMNVAPLTVKTSWLNENAVVIYDTNLDFKPYLKAGFFQVLANDNSRAILATPINGAIPQLTANRSGFTAGAGVMWNIRMVKLNFIYQRIESGSAYSSNQFTLVISTNFDSHSNS